MKYSPLTEHLLKSAQERKQKLKQAERKRILYNLYRQDSDLERKFYNNLEVPMRKFLYNFSKFNFMNFRRLDRLVYTPSRSEQKSGNVRELTNGVILAGLGTGSFFSIYLIGSNLINKFDSFELMNKIDLVGLEAILTGSGLLLATKGAKKIINSFKKQEN